MSCFTYLLILMFCGFALFFVPSSEAQSYTGVLTLDPIASKIKSGSTVTFSGQLHTESGYVVTDATIYIKDDVSFGRDTVIRKTSTDSNGNFATSWTAQPRNSGAWDFYAVYNGASDVSKARSTTQQVRVSDGYSKSQSQSYSTTIRLDRIPSSAYAGDSVTFTGKLTSNSSPVPGAWVYIKEDDFGPDQTLNYGKTDSNGHFSIPWTVTSGFAEIDFDIYAVFESSSPYTKDRSSNQVMSVFERQSFPTTIRLDRILSQVYAGDPVIFTGKLTSNGSPVSGVKIYIKEDDPGLPDQYIGYGITDNNGRFSISWTVGAGLVETDFDIYAVFEGSTSYTKARSFNQVMSVFEHGGYITLDPFVKSASIGSLITFTGTLEFDSHDSEGAIVYIKDEDSFRRDDLLATGFVDNNGRFSATWRVYDADPDSTVDIFAVFEGNNVLKRLTTCGSGCLDTMPLQVYESTITPPNDKDLSGEYIELYHSFMLDRPPRVLIIPQPDAYDEVQRHIQPVKDGIKTWSEMLERQYGGNWNVYFDVIQKGDVYKKRGVNYDITMSLITPEQDKRCIDDAYGWAYPHQPRPISTSVCSISGDKFRSDAGVSATAGHEFVHAMGLGHAFNKPGDLMCSAEKNNRGEYIPTCKPLFPKSKTPSNLNLDAIVALYGVDGFLNPNNNIKDGTKFRETSNSNIPQNTPSNNQLEEYYIPERDTFVPQLQRAPLSALRILDSFGNTIDDVYWGQQVVITADIQNTQTVSQEFAYIVLVQDDRGITVAFTWLTDTLPPGQSFILSQSWTPEYTDIYTVTAFAWESLSVPSALSPPMQMTVFVN